MLNDQRPLNSPKLSPFVSWETFLLPLAKSSVGFQSSPEQLLLSSAEAVLFDAEATGAARK